MPTGGVDVAAAGAFFGSDIAGAALGSAALGAEVGAGLGGIESAISGGNPLTGALKGAAAGGLTGGGIGLGGGLIGGVAGDVVGGALGGAAGGALTGGNIGMSALEGGAAGGISGLMSPGGTTGGGASGTTSAAASAPAAGAGVDISPDLAQAATSTGVDSTGTMTAQSVGSPASAGGGANVGTQQTPIASIGGDSVRATATTPGTYTGFGSQPGGANISGAVEGPNSAFTPAGTGGNSVVNALKNPSLSNIETAVGKNSNLLMPAAALGADALKQNQTLKGERQLQDQAGKLAGQGTTLSNYLATGTLPPGVQQSINQATNSAKATIRSKYASMGMSGSSAEQSELAAADAAAQGQGAQIAAQLLDTGLKETGMASELYRAILQASESKDAALSSAIGGFASSMAGGHAQPAA